VTWLSTGVAASTAGRGPTPQPVAAWTDVINRTHASGKRVLGHVDTGYLGQTGLTTRLGSTWGPTPTTRCPVTGLWNRHRYPVAPPACSKPVGITTLALPGGQYVTNVKITSDQVREQ
jgi:hypothetical protein